MQTRATAVSDFFSNYATSEQVYLEHGQLLYQRLRQAGIPGAAIHQHLRPDRPVLLRPHLRRQSGHGGHHRRHRSSRKSPPGPDRTPPQESASWQSPAPSSMERRSRAWCGWSSSLELVDHQFLLLIAHRLGSQSGRSDHGVCDQPVLCPLHRGARGQHHRDRQAHCRRQLRDPDRARNTTTRSGSWPTPSTTCP